MADRFKLSRKLSGRASNRIPFNAVISVQPSRISGSSSMEFGSMNWRTELVLCKPSINSSTPSWFSIVKIWGIGNSSRIDSIR